MTTAIAMNISIKTLLTIMLTIYFEPIFPQKDFRLPDSLFVTLEKNPQQDLNRIEVLAEIIDYCNKSRQYLKAEPYIDEIMQISENIENKYIKALSCFYKGTILLNKNEFKESLSYLNKGLRVVSSLPENEKTIRLHARLLNSLGAFYSDKQMYSESYECFSSGLEICENIDDLYLTSMLEINTATILNQIGKHDEAIDLCKKNLMRGIGLTTNRFVVFTILAESYRYKSSYDIALDYIDSAYMTSATRYDESCCLSNKAILYCDKRDNKNAKRIFKYILDEYRNELFAKSEIATMVYYGYLVGVDTKSDSAISYIDSAILKAQEYNLPTLEIECCASKSKLLYKYCEYEKFAESIMKYIALRDSLDIVNDQQHLETAWLSDEFRKTKEQLRLEKELSDIKNEKAKTRLYLVILGLDSIIVILILAFNRKKVLIKSKNIQLKNKELEKEVLNKEIESCNRELTAKALVQVQRQELLTEMIERLKAIVDDKRKLSQNLNEVIVNFEKYKNSTTPKDFDYYFTQTNPNFYKHLLADFPNLTPYEQRLCAFLKLNLNTKDIATISNISPDSAKVARARLRKSLHLVGTDEDLTVFLSRY